MGEILLHKSNGVNNRPGREPIDVINRVQELARKGDISGQINFYLLNGYWAEEPEPVLVPKCPKCFGKVLPQEPNSSFCQTCKRHWTPQECR